MALGSLQNNALTKKSLVKKGIPSRNDLTKLPSHRKFATK